MHNMRTHLGAAWATLLISLAASLTLCAGEGAQPLVLLDFEKGFDLGRVGTQDAKVSLKRGEEGTVLRVETGTESKFPGITLRSPKGSWDLSSRAYLSLDVTNVGKESVTVHCRVDNPGADGFKNCETGSENLKPGREGTIKVPLLMKLEADGEVKFIGMRGDPPVSMKLDPSNVTQLVVFVANPKKTHTFEVRQIRAAGRSYCLRGSMRLEDFFPMIDEFGQYIHKDWPRKTHTLTELAAHAKAEEKDLAANPGPSDRNEYGGWTGGPQLQATGFFRAEQYQGKWWLVDPKGRLFWSHGIDCVRSGNPTPITDREHYYRDLPTFNSPFSQFYGTGRWAPHDYYKDHASYRTYDFSRANLLRKYGDDREKAFADITHRRLKSWGMNTIANWSDGGIYLMRRTPYVATINFRARKLEGSTGYWGKFPDVFDPNFRNSLQRRFVREKGTTAGDPWCIGFFVDNELSWGDEVSLAVAALVSPPEQTAKKVFLADLKAKYDTIEKLNTAWGATHTSWEALLECERAPDRKKAWADLTAFYTKTAETYFHTIRDTLKDVAPNQLYLGCRFAWVNDRAARAAAKFCDVVSYNRYSYSVEQQRLPDNINKPIIIGEFHFGALDRGMFHTGLRKADDQNHRAQLYGNYVRGALRNPCIVGTHWFQYKDQPTTGRGDGENYQIGFVDICDTPYAEIIGASRQVGYRLYEIRLTAK